MPRENRKRGKKHKKKAEEVAEVHQDDTQYTEEQEVNEAGPSWIVPARDTSVIDQNAPFGYVDAEVKAYFRTVDIQIREWQETRPEVEEDADVDPNEDRRLFFVAALEEMSGKEKQLATDPDCSTILERMIHSMDDFVRRVFMDRLSGSFEQLSKHRFASHVCQTLLTVAADTIARETRGIFPPTPESQEEGELRTLTQLVLDACEELLPTLSSLVLDPFASHVIRALLSLLAPDILGSPEDSNGGGRPGAFALRSKKSAAWKARQGSMKSVFVENDAQVQKTSRKMPKEFRSAASKFVSTLREQLGENEVRALAANQVASPVLQMMLELEAAYGQSDAPGSLMDHVLVGLITLIHENPNATAPEADYLVTLLRDPTASHLLETLVRRSPDRVFDLLWQTYFVGKLARLAVHPVANFVVARAFERLNSAQLDAALPEVQGAAGKIVKNARTGVLRALVDRAATLHDHAPGVLELIATAFDLSSDEDKKLFVPCILRLKPLAEYKRAVEAARKAAEEPQDEEPKHKRRKTEDPLEPSIQGAVLLQSMLCLPSPHVNIVLDSLQAMGVDGLIEMAHHAVSSRVLDAVLESPTVAHKDKRKLVMTFLGHYHRLVDDRIGSRVGERCWAFADPYLKEKIARSVMPYEHALAGSAFGKFFARHLALHVLQRDPERWKSMQSAAKAPSAPAAQPVPSTKAPVAHSQASQSKAAQVQERKTAAPAAAASDASGSESEAEDVSPKKAKGKRKGGQPQDEIDALFDATLGKKVKKAELASAAKEVAEPKGDAVEKVKKVKEKSKGKSKKRKEREEGEDEVDKDLKDVLGAIRAAPKEDKGPKKKRAH
ncbi:ARM repeat-containing protein [Trametes coccinea BRFM310]|uniref:Nucleolar protein 9 n=1 Tax=Trametes coccinea (strain BRFM310) TaxID=1353009 RepID=A0A1Y2INK1_TRAC3|nr:ARM repeat-containing protein [Trametes coccinea BRFM310]